MKQLVKVFIPTVTLMLLSGLCLGVFVSSADAQGSDEYEVIGRVVNDKGEPVSTAGVYLEPASYKANSFERFVEIADIGPDGKFKFSLNKTKAKDQGDFELFVMDGDTEGFWITISPPYDALKRYSSHFNGKRVTLGDKDRIDVGDVKVQFWYGNVKLSFARPMDWENIFLRIRDLTGHVAYYSSLSRNDVAEYVKKSGLELNISLPEGKWIADIVNDDATKVFSESSTFEISKGKTATVRMQNSRR